MQILQDDSILKQETKYSSYERNIKGEGMSRWEAKTSNQY